jgi:hypothetical protein
MPNTKPNEGADSEPDKGPGDAEVNAQTANRLPMLLTSPIAFPIIPTLTDVNRPGIPGDTPYLGSEDGVMENKTRSNEVAARSGP